LTELWAFFKNIAHLAGASLFNGHISSFTVLSFFKLGSRTFGLGMSHIFEPVGLDEKSQTCEMAVHIINPTMFNLQKSKNSIRNGVIFEPVT